MLVLRRRGHLTTLEQRFSDLVVDHTSPQYLTGLMDPKKTIICSTRGILESSGPLDYLYQNALNSQLDFTDSTGRYGFHELCHVPRRMD